MATVSTFTVPGEWSHPRQLWVDDLRDPGDFAVDPGNAWVWCTTVQDALNQLEWANDFNEVGDVFWFSEISLDHDMGEVATTMRIVDWCQAKGRWPEVFTIHSANPVGRDNLVRAINASAPMNVTICILNTLSKGL